MTPVWLGKTFYFTKDSRAEVCHLAWLHNFSKKWPLCTVDCMYVSKKKEFGYNPLLAYFKDAEKDMSLFQIRILWKKLLFTQSSML